jgi:energy-coupling factor transporter ATP-binding protein EcfA2
LVVIGLSGNEIIFELKDVNFNYPSGEKALEGINLTINRGEKVALLGANGSGKSTLLKLLSGLLFTKEGTLQALGQSISEESMANEEFAFAFRRRVGFVFQNSDAQLFNANVWEEIAFGPVQLGGRRSDRHVGPGTLSPTTTFQAVRRGEEAGGAGMRAFTESGCVIAG